MGDKKKTAVDLLLDKITDYEMGETLLRLIGKDEIDHIRKVEREQIIDAYHLGQNGMIETYFDSMDIEWEITKSIMEDKEDAEQFYEETYGE